MDDDLIKRLQTRCVYGDARLSMWSRHDPLSAEAAAEIYHLRAEIERLKADGESQRAESSEWKRQALYHNKKHGEMIEEKRLAEAERDEALAQVATAYEAAAYEADFYSYLAGDKIRALTPADAKAALEAYGREKVREGLEIAITAMNGVLRRGPNEWAFGTGGYSNPMDAARDAILAEMEKLK